MLGEAHLAIPLEPMLDSVSDSDALRSHFGGSWSRSHHTAEHSPQTFGQNVGLRSLDRLHGTHYPPSLKNKDLSPTVFRSKLNNSLV